MADEGRKHVDPRLLALMDKAGVERGLNVEELSAGDVVRIETHSGNVYTMEVLDPKKRRVKAKGGKLGAKFVETYANGSSLTGTGTMIRLGWIALGYRFLLGLHLLSPTRRVTLNGFTVLP